MTRNAPSLSMNPPDMLTPKYNAAATHLAKKKLVGIMGQEKFAAFVTANGGFQLANLAKILPPELLRLGAGGLPAAAPTQPTAAPKPPTPAKTAAPAGLAVGVKLGTASLTQSKPAATPGKPSGAMSIAEAESLALKVFPNCTTSLNVTEAARWKSLEGVFAANGHNAPWTDAKSIGIPSDKLAGHSARQAKISAVFETGFTRAEFSKLSARDQSDFCKNGGQLQD